MGSGGSCRGGLGGVGHVGVGWVMQGWGGSCRGGMGHTGVGWGRSCSGCENFHYIIWSVTS